MFGTLLGIPVLQVPNTIMLGTPSSKNASAYRLPMGSTCRAALRSETTGSPYNLRVAENQLAQGISLGVPTFGQEGDPRGYDMPTCLQIGTRFDSQKDVCHSTALHRTRSNRALAPSIPQFYRPPRREPMTIGECHHPKVSSGK